jgi:ABC-type xylose transport system permease subunit
VILEEVQVESAIVASEMLSTSPEIYQQVIKGLVLILAVMVDLINKRCR